MAERIETQRTISAPPAQIFALLCDPRGHVAIDSSGMLQDAEGDPVSAVGDTFVAWTILGQIRPQIGHVYGYRLEPTDDGAATVVTSFYDWSAIDQQWRDAGIFPVISEGALRATLGILDRTVRGRAGPA
jgi:hypothetical protein